MSSDRRGDYSQTEKLIQELEDGTITESNRRELMDLMRSDELVREQYLRHMELVSLLGQTAENRVKLGTMPVSPEMVRADRRRGAVKSIVYGVAALLLVGVAALLIKTQLNVGEVDELKIAFQRSNHSDVKVSRNGRDIYAQSTLKVGDVVVLDHGLVQFTFPNGVEALAEGPCELELVSDVSVRLKGGLAWFRVPPEGVGFTVETDRMKVEDLGTEFGVWFDAEDRQQVHVGKGRVRVYSGEVQHELTEGNALLVDKSGELKKHDFQAVNFRKEFDKGMPYMHWSFDDFDKGKFVAEGDLGDPAVASASLKRLFSASVENPASYQKDGRYGKCFAMNGDGVFAETRLFPIGGNAPRTVAAWVRHRSDSYGAGGRTPYCSWGKRETGRLWKLFLEHGDTGVMLYTSAMESALSSKLKGEYAPNKWVHVASVYTGRMRKDGFPEVYHYVNGKLAIPEAFQAVTEIDTDISSADAMPLRIGAALENREGDKSVNGDVDELYLFRGVLSEEQIRELMLENKFEQ